MCDVIPFWSNFWSHGAPLCVCSRSKSSAQIIHDGIQRLFGIIKRVQLRRIFLSAALHSAFCRSVIHCYVIPSTMNKPNQIATAFVWEAAQRTRGTCERASSLLEARTPARGAHFSLFILHPFVFIQAHCPRRAAKKSEPLSAHARINYTRWPSPPCALGAFSCLASRAGRVKKNEVTLGFCVPLCDALCFYAARKLQPEQWIL